MKNKIASAAPLANTIEIVPSEKSSLPPALPPEIQVPPRQEDREQQQIRELAFRLYEERGRVDGFAERDWLEAEAIMRQQRKMAA